MVRWSDGGFLSFFLGLLGVHSPSKMRQNSEKNRPPKVSKKKSSTCWESFCWTSGDLFFFCSRNRFTPSWSGLCIQKSNQPTGNSIGVGEIPYKLPKHSDDGNSSLGQIWFMTMFPWILLDSFEFSDFSVWGLVGTVYQLRWVVSLCRHFTGVSRSTFLGDILYFMIQYFRGLVRGLTLDSPKGKNRLPITMFVLIVFFSIVLASYWETFANTQCLRDFISLCFGAYFALQIMTSTLSIFFPPFLVFWPNDWILCQ